LKDQETYRDNNIIVAQVDTIERERDFREKIAERKPKFKGKSTDNRRTID
jgi:hypothetical protein